MTIDTTYIPTGEGPAATVPLAQAATLSNTLTRTIVYTYDNFYRLAEAAYSTHSTLPAVAGQAGEVLSYTYDPNGNLITKTLVGGQVISYTYDAENHLTQVISGSETTQFIYDGDGRRVKRLAPGGETTIDVGDHYQVTANQNGWSENVPVFGPTGNDQGSPDLVSDADGTLYLVWTEYPTEAASVYFAQRSPAGGWSEPFLVGTGEEPAVTIDPSGNVYVAWQRNSGFSYDIYLRRRAGGTWDNSIAVADSQYDETRPALAAAPDGSVYLAWEGYNAAAEQHTISVARQVGGSWAVEFQTEAIIGNGQYRPALAADNDSNVFLAYVDETADQNGDLYVIGRLAGSGWPSASTAEFVDYASSQKPSAADTDSQGNLFVAYTSGTSLCIRRRDVAGGWQFNGCIADVSDYNGIDMIVDDDNSVNWTKTNNDDWPALQVNNNNVLDNEVRNPAGPVLATGPEGTLVVIWSSQWQGVSPSRLFMATEGPQVTKHYYANGQRIASRVNDSLYYFLGDHLGSTTVVADADGNKVGHVVYDPYGEVLENTLPPGLTDRLFTGYRWDDTIGLYDANARFYDPELGQFTQPDSLVPEPYHPISLNRYAYTYNSPVNYTDSSGHFIDTLWDAVDLGANLRNCLGDTDSLSCYMVPVAAAVMVVPGLTTGPVDNAVKSIVLHSDEIQIAKSYEAIGRTEAGPALIQRAKIHGLPTVKFEPHGALGEYQEVANRILLKSDFRDLPPELGAVTLAHELSHRTRRWYLHSQEDELWAFIDQSRVWRELRDQVDLATLSPRGLKIVETHNRVLDYLNQGEDALVSSSWFQGRYGHLPRFGRDTFFDRDVAKIYIPRVGR